MVNKNKKDTTEKSDLDKYIEEVDIIIDQNNTSHVTRSAIDSIVGFTSARKSLELGIIRFDNTFPEDIFVDYYYGTSSTVTNGGDTYSSRQRTNSYRSTRIGFTLCDKLLCFTSWEDSGLSQLALALLNASRVRKPFVQIVGVKIENYFGVRRIKTPLCEYNDVNKMWCDIRLINSFKKDIKKDKLDYKFVRD